jgi:hypothetical protein
MKNIIILLIAVICMIGTTPAHAGIKGAQTQEVVKPPKKKGFNYRAHAQKNKKASKRASQKFKGRDMTKYNCRR